MPDSKDYLAKKRALLETLTIYGRKPVLEALENPAINVSCVHLAESNQAGGIIASITEAADARNISIRSHSREALSRISKNRKQDQGVAADIRIPGFMAFDNFIHTPPDNFTLLAIDRVTNPQNLGMIVRTVCASPCDAILMPEKGCAALDALVIKASAGTLFSASIIRCANLATALHQLHELGADTIGLDASADLAIQHLPNRARQVFVLGNETEGLSQEVRASLSHRVKIPMVGGIESLNVAVTAGLVTFRDLL